MGEVLTDLGILAAVFLVATAVAALAGAANLGTAATAGQVAFGAALVWVLVRR